MGNFERTGDDREFRNITFAVTGSERQWAEEFCARTGRTLSSVCRIALRELRYKLESEES